jgi:hypothetical protein
MLLLKDSPEKTAADATTLLGLNTVEGPNNPINQGFHTVPGRLPPMQSPGHMHRPPAPGPLHQVHNVNFQLETPEEYWRRQEIITQDLDRQLREQRERDIIMKEELDAIKDRKYSGTPGSSLPKTAMKLPTTSPPKFAGEALNYLPWKKL